MSATQPDQKYRVFKFGGSSVGNADRLTHIIETIIDERSKSPMAVVVSAMGDTTDWLIAARNIAAEGDLEGAEALVDRVADLAVMNAMVVLRETDDNDATQRITPLVREILAPLRQLLLGVSLLRERTQRSLDLVMSFGERLSAQVVVHLLNASGTDAEFVDARDWVVTDDNHGHARVDWPASKAALDELSSKWGDVVPVCTGFLGQTPDGITTTLGRNGSDYTATLLARGLAAGEVVICTDVSGVMTADPTIVDEAYPVPHLTYLEALELANYGAKMFHSRTMLPLIESGIAMRIRNTMNPDDRGTRITAKATESESGPICVTSLENLALVDVRWRELSKQVQMGKRVLAALESVGVGVWMATQAAHGQAVAVAVPRADLEIARKAIHEELALEFERHEVEPIEVRDRVTLLSLVAETMNEATDVAGRFFYALGQVGVNVLAIAQGESSRSISCVIPQDDTRVAVRTVHTAFNFAHQEVNVFVLGKGVVGSELLQQVRDQRAMLLETQDMDIRVVGLADSGHIRFDAEGIDLASGELESLFETDAVKNEAEALDRALDALQRRPVPVLVDCTAASGMEDVYRRAFERGIHVVGANKKPLAVSWDRRETLMGDARKHHRAYHYETTVGASLPVIETLKNLVRTGDRVLRIEGAFSGTLGYLTNEVMAGKTLSQAVETARNLGYTEPRPQDDLSGLDVARKALILARELGLQVELEDISVEPLVAPEIIDTPDLDSFFSALRAQDDEFEARIAEMRAADKTLRYLAIIDPGDEDREPSVKVGPVAVEAQHPATRLRGSESFVAFTTARYEDYPLIVQGAGAGGAVTAAGVLSDVLRIAQNLRGN